ncbi:unnamed protein product [Caenorhabditis angaria]|uniref:Lysozyme n=1 Tax=Caenorhabditis angaria TaxID=860376 RepID=A0A9P1MW56_9PELO|nr:unnamed protein product [Caenorhabditis angaria]
MHILLIFLVVSTVSSARHGYDFIQPITESTAACLKKAGISFVIPRLFTNLGHIDETGINNVKHARAAGIEEVDGYLFPCIGSKCPSAANQVKTVSEKLSAEKTHINTLWLDIERLNWPANHETNRKFIEELVAEAKALKHTVGIYSNYYNWEAIVGLDYHGQSSLPLWWAEYDGTPGFAKYKEFGGWKQPKIHQWHGTEKGSCDVSIDANYIP